MYIYTGFHVHLYWFSCTFILVFMYIYTGFHIHLYCLSYTFILVFMYIYTGFHVLVYWFRCTFILVFMYIYTVFHFIMIFIIKSETKILVTVVRRCFNFLLEKSKLSFFNSTFLKFLCNVSFVFLWSFKHLCVHLNYLYVHM